MKRLLLAGLCAGLFQFAFAAAPTAPVRAVPEIKVINLASEYAAFWDATRHMPEGERVAAFKQQVASRFPEFYGIERYDGDFTQAQQDERIARSFVKFEPMRAAYQAVVGRFSAELPRHIASFATAFPDFQPTVPTFLLHSLNEMDGGTRTFNGKTYLIFGADRIATLHGEGDAAPFFHHELFHIHHEAAMTACDGQGMWLPLWQEGLATYVSKALNPQATEEEMLLEFPAGSLPLTKARLYDSFAHLDTVLDNTDYAKQYPPLFNSAKDDTGLAPRRGYYLGYLVAAEIGKTRDLQTLASLSCDDAKQLVRMTVAKLKQANRPAQ